GNGAPVAGIFSRFQADLKRRNGLVQPRRRRIENDSRPPNAVVQSLVREHKPVLPNLRFQTTAATFPLHAAQLENVGKLSIEFDRERDIDSGASIVVDSKPFVTCFLPQNLRSENVHGSSGHYYFTIPPGI